MSKRDKMTKLANLRKKLMTDRETREEYAKADAEFAHVEVLLKACHSMEQGSGTEAGKKLC